MKIYQMFVKRVKMCCCAEFVMNNSSNRKVYRVDIFCKPFQLKAVNSSSSVVNDSCPLKCPACKEEMHNIKTSEDIDCLKCDLFLLNLMNATDSMKNISCNEVSTPGVLVNNCTDETFDDLGDKSAATKCATHFDYDFTFCCMDCQNFALRRMHERPIFC